MRIGNIRNIAIAVMVLQACDFAIAGNVVSRPLNVNDTEPAEGIAYALPAVYARITVDRKKITPENVSSALKAADGNIAEKTAEVEAIKKAIQERIEFSALAGITEEKDDELAKLRKGLIAAVAALSEANALKGEVKKLSEKLKELGLKNGESGYADKIVIKLEPTVGDPSHRFVLKMDHSMTRDDSWVFKTTPEGLLTSSESTAASKHGELLVELSRLVGAVSGQAGAFSGVPYIAPESAGKSVVQPLPPTCDQFAGPFHYERIFDPSAGFSGNRGRAADTPSDDKKDAKPKVDGKLSVASVTEINTDLCGLGASIKLRSVAMSGDLAVTEVPKNKTLNGIVYRRPLPYELQTITCRTPENAKPCSLKSSNVDSLMENEYISDTKIILIPNNAPLAVLPYDDLLFVTAHTDATFVDGMLTDVTASRPSELLAIAKTPVEMLKALGDGIKNVSPVQIDYMDRQSRQVEAETKLAKAQKELVEAQKALEETKHK